MNNKKSQAGNAHLLMVILISIAIIGALGYYFWQNNNKNNQKSITAQVEKENNDTTKKDDGKTDVQDTETAASDVVLSEVAYDKTTSSGLAIKYPKTWKITNTTTDQASGQVTDTTKITSSDGKVVVNYRVALASGGGGICPAPVGKPTQLVVLNPDTINGYENVRFVAYIDHDTVYDTYSYYAGVQVISDEVLSVKVGDVTDSCDSFGMYHNGDIIIYNGNTDYPWITLSIELKDIIEGSSLDDINNAMKTDNFLIAKRIVQSLYVR